MKTKAVVECADAIEWLKAQPSDSVDLVFGSPPYCDARTYGIGAQRTCIEWVEWMLDVTTEAHRVSRGPVFWVAAGVTRKRNYWPACEGLMWEWWKRGDEHQLYRPCVFHRIGVPGSGNSDYLRADWEYVMCFKKPGELAWSDNTAMGHASKWAPGGEMSNRLSDGTRRNQWGGGEKSTKSRQANGARQKSGRPSHKIHTKREANGETRDQNYVVPAIANPGNVIQQTYTAEEVRAIIKDLLGVESSDVSKHLVGGGLMGDKRAHENEAPYPETLPEFFIRSFCPPEGTVCDVFSGSGTTAAVALRHGRSFFGCDVRESQVALTKRRISEVQVRMF